jgi:hypothetical protein
MVGWMESAFARSRPAVQSFTALRHASQFGALSAYTKTRHPKRNTTKTPVMTTVEHAFDTRSVST